MYPDVFPRRFDDADPEFVVYQTLRSLPDSYVVFYSKRLQGVTTFGNPETEIDFLIWNQRDVLICLEVKGGLISYDGAHDRWSQNGDPMTKGPDRQASAATHALLSALTDELRNVNTGWALCFPHCVLVPGGSPTGVPRQRIVDEAALRDVASAVKSIEDDIRRTHGKRGVDAAASMRLMSRLTSSIGFVTILGVRIAREAEHLVQVTDEQLEVLHDLEINPRVVIHGAAGTGKTILAQEFAKRLAADGKSVLLLFYNRGIAKLVRSAFERHASVQVSTFASFAKRLTQEVFPDWWDGATSKDDEFWTLELPAKLFDIPADRRPIFDAVIVDEGQDFKAEWLEYLATVLRSSHESRFCVFLDEHQDIFGHWTHFPSSPAAFRKVLTRNCRNTKEIVNYLERRYPTGLKVFERSPTGTPVVERTVRNAVDEQTQLVRDIKHLVTVEKVRPGSIVILLNSPKADSSLAATRSIAGYELRSTYDRYGPDESCIYYSTIDIFKGLEADVVMVLLGDAVASTDLSRTLYVEGSRAKHVLYIYARR
jgi:hypothetical protein